MPARKVRRAFYCPKCMVRTFLIEGRDPWDLVPSCGQHGPMVREPNRPYFGESTEPPVELGVPGAVPRPPLKVSS